MFCTGFIGQKTGCLALSMLVLASTCPVSGAGLRSGTLSADWETQTLSLPVSSAVRAIDPRGRVTLVELLLKAVHELRAAHPKKRLTSQDVHVALGETWTHATVSRVLKELADKGEISRRTLSRKQIYYDIPQPESSPQNPPLWRGLTPEEFMDNQFFHRMGGWRIASFVLGETGYREAMGHYRHVHDQMQSGDEIDDDAINKELSELLTLEIISLHEILRQSRLSLTALQKIQKKHTRWSVATTLSEIRQSVGSNFVNLKRLPGENGVPKGLDEFRRLWLSMSPHQLLEELRSRHGNITILQTDADVERALQWLDMHGFVFVQDHGRWAVPTSAAQKPFNVSYRSWSDKHIKEWQSLLDKPVTPRIVAQRIHMLLHEMNWGVKRLGPLYVTYIRHLQADVAQSMPISNRFTDYVEAAALKLQVDPVLLLTGYSRSEYWLVKVPSQLPALKMGQRIRLIRQARGMSLATLASMPSLKGFKQGYLSEFEQDKVVTEPWPSTVARMAEALGVDPYFIILGLPENRIHESQVNAGEMAKAIRFASGLNQDEFAHRLGVTTEIVYDWEKNGPVEVSLEDLIAGAKGIIQPGFLQKKIDAFNKEQARVKRDESLLEFIKTHFVDFFASGEFSLSDVLDKATISKTQLYRRVKQAIREGLLEVIQVSERVQYQYQPSPKELSKGLSRFIVEHSSVLTSGGIFDSANLLGVGALSKAQVVRRISEGVSEGIFQIVKKGHIQNQFRWTPAAQKLLHTSA